MGNNEIRRRPSHFCVFSMSAYISAHAKTSSKNGDFLKVRPGKTKSGL